MTDTAYKSAEGHDFSDYQPVQSVTSIKAMAFAVAKATEGTGWAGKTFAANWANMLTAGKPRGAYHFYHPAEDPIAQARFFMGVIAAAGGLVKGDILAVDAEIMQGTVLGAEHDIRRHLPVTAADLALTPAQVDAGVLAFLNEVSRLAGPGHPILVYTMHAVGQYLVRTAKAYPDLWFAWPSSTAPDAALIAPWKKWRIWQWGADSHGDRDAYNGTVADLTAWLAGYTGPPVVTFKALACDGTETLRQIARNAGASTGSVLAWTLKRVPWQGKLIGYLDRHNWDAAVPKGVILMIRIVS